MLLSDLLEARRNPEQNTVARRWNATNELLRWEGKEYFATYTDLPKVGINPRSQYSTPIGVYCYPLGDEQIIDHIGNGTLPFAGDAPYISVLRNEGHVVDLKTDDFKILNTRVAEWLADRIKINKRETDTDNVELTREEKLQKIWGIVYMVAGTQALVRTPGGIWWSFTRLAAALICGQGKDGWWDLHFDFVPQHVIRNTNNIKGLPAKWTRLMLDIGVDGVVDQGGISREGEGIIHVNEPTQAVMFNMSKTRVVDRILNHPLKLEIVIDNPKKLRSFLSKTPSYENYVSFYGLCVKLFTEKSFKTTVEMNRNLTKEVQEKKVAKVTFNINDFTPYLPVLSEYIWKQNQSYRNYFLFSMCQYIAGYHSSHMHLQNIVRSSIALLNRVYQYDVIHDSMMRYIPYTDNMEAFQKEFLDPIKPQT